jgi:hypothetical protein
MEFMNRVEKKEVGTACDLEELYIDVRRNSIFNRLRPATIQKVESQARQRDKASNSSTWYRLGPIQKFEQVVERRAVFLWGRRALLRWGGIRGVYADVVFANLLLQRNNISEIPGIQVPQIPNDNDNRPGHTLWQFSIAMDPAQVNLAAVQSSALNVVVQKL